MKMTDVKEKTPNKRKSLAANDVNSAKKAKVQTPKGKQNGTPKAPQSNKKSPVKQTPGKNAGKAGQSPAKKLQTFPGTGAANKQANKLAALQGNKKQETIETIKQKIEEIESAGDKSNAAKKKLANLKKLLSQAENPKAGKPNKKPVKEEEVDDEEEEEDEDDEEESGEEIEGEVDSDDVEEESGDDEEGDDEEEDEEAEEVEGEETEKQKKPIVKVKKEIQPLNRFDVYVTDLHFDCTEDDIKEYFKSVGEITKVVMLRTMATHKFIGKAFLHLPDRESFVKCFNYHGTIMHGRRISVAPATNKKSKGGFRKPFNSPKKFQNKNFKKGPPPHKGGPKKAGGPKAKTEI